MLLGWLETMRLPAWHGEASKGKQSMWNSIRAFARRLDPLHAMNLEEVPVSYRQFAQEMRFGRESAIPESAAPLEVPREAATDAQHAEALRAGWEVPLAEAAELAAEALRLIPRAGGPEGRVLSGDLARRWWIQGTQSAPPAA